MGLSCSKTGYNTNWGLTNSFKCRAKLFGTYTYSCCICLLEFFVNFKPKNDKKIPLGKCDSFTRMLQMNPPDDWLKTGWAWDSQTRTWLMISLFCIACLLKNNAFSVLHYIIKVTLHYLMLQCTLLRDSFCLGTFTHVLISRRKSSFKPCQNEHDSVKGARD